MVKECIGKVANLRTPFSLYQPLGRFSLYVAMSMARICHILKVLPFFLVLFLPFTKVLGKNIDYKNIPYSDKRKVKRFSVSRIKDFFKRETK